MLYSLIEIALIALILHWTGAPMLIVVAVFTLWTVAFFVLNANSEVI